MSAFDVNFKSMVDQINTERSGEINDVDDDSLTEDSSGEDEETEEVDESEEEEESEGEEEDAASDENQDAPKSKGKKEAPQEAGEIADFPLYEVNKEEIPQYSVDEVYSAWYNDTMQKGIQQILGDSVKDYKSIDELSAALGPAAWSRLERQAQKLAQEKAQTYNQQVVEPYTFKQTSNQILQEVNQLVKLPAMKQLPKYLPRMAELNAELKGKFPSLEHDPVRAIPLLYMLAREEELGGTMKSIAKEKQKSVPGFEKGGVDRNITTKKKRDDRDEFMEKVKKNNKKVDPLGGIFALPRERMTFNNR